MFCNPSLNRNKPMAPLSGQTGDDVGEIALKLNTKFYFLMKEILKPS